MIIFFSLLFFFLLISGLVCVYHFLFWNSNDGGSRCWLSSFECGFHSGMMIGCYFSYTYFILLVFFVIFDLEVSLLLNVPFSFCYLKNSLFYLFFLLILGVSYGIELYSGYVRWSY